MSSRFFITTAIDYVNSRPHLGTAYEKITADVVARYKRLCGVETYFMMGNDEHSQNVYKRAVEQGLDPLAYCDRMEQEFRSVWAALNLSFDDFIRTTEPRHRTAVQKLAQRAYEQDDIYEGVYEGWYCVSCEAFKQEKDLIEGRCPLHPTLTPEWLREKNYFFRLSKYRDRILDHVRQNPGFIQPDVRRNEILRLLEAGLEDISVSRAGQLWGIPLPFAPENVVYVWFDALINYAAAVGYGTDEEKFATWWPANLHVIGKDITRFHTVVWPAMLMSAGIPLPEQVFGHGWVNFGGQRMSKSLGTSLDPMDVAKRFGADALRLYLTKEISYGSDGDFTWERYEERYNVDLANNLGNLVSRLAAMAEKFRALRVSPGESSGRLADVTREAIVRYRAGMDSLALHEGAAAAFSIVDAANAHIAETAPWALAKDPAQAARLDGVLFDVSEAIRVAAVLLLPFIPESAAEILRRIGETRSPHELRFDRDAPWRSDGVREITKGPALWPRSEDRQDPAGKVSAQTPPSAPATAPAQTTQTASTAAAAAAGAESPKERVMEQSSPAAPPSATPPADAVIPDDARISIDDFMRVELRVAKVLEAESVPKSKKLLKLRIDVGTEQRTLVAGIAEAYAPEQLIGRSIVIVFNLKPAKLMGIESNGMVLAASQEGGKPVLLAVDESIRQGRVSADPSSVQPPATLIDSHCHIAGPEFTADLDAVVGRARGAGLAHALVILAADDEPELAQAAAVTAAWPAVRFAIGVHPHAAGKFAEAPAAAAEAVDRAVEAQPLTRGLGEIGLDYHYDLAPRDSQRAVFAAQIRLARRRRLPIVIHTREAEDDTFDILREEQAAEVGGVFHCFTGDRAMARRALDIGFHLSLAGIVTFPRALELKEVARMLPLDRLLIETDSPFLAPVPHRGKRNEPAHVAVVAEVIANLRGITAREVAEAAADNFRRIFTP